MKNSITIKKKNNEIIQKIKGKKLSIIDIIDTLIYLLPCDARAKSNLLLNSIQYTKKKLHINIKRSFSTVLTNIKTLMNSLLTQEKLGTLYDCWQLTIMLHNNKFIFKKLLMNL